MIDASGRSDCSIPANVDLEKAFKKIDQDGSGTISKDEMFKQVGATGGLSKAEFDEVFGLIDQDVSCISF